MDTAIIVFAAVTLIIALVCGLAPIFSAVKDDKNRLKQLTGIAAVSYTHLTLPTILLV